MMPASVGCVALYPHGSRAAKSSVDRASELVVWLVESEVDEKIFQWNIGCFMGLGLSVQQNLRSMCFRIILVGMGV